MMKIVTATSNIYSFISSPFHCSMFWRYQKDKIYVLTRPVSFAYPLVFENTQLPLEAIEATPRRTEKWVFKIKSETSRERRYFQCYDRESKLSLRYGPVRFVGELHREVRGKIWKLYYNDPKGKFILSPQEQRQIPRFKVSSEGLLLEIDVLMRSPIKVPSEVPVA